MVLGRSRAVSPIYIGEVFDAKNMAVFNELLKRSLRITLKSCYYVRVITYAIYGEKL